MSLDELTITLSDQNGRVNADTLKKALENALELLRSIESSIVASNVDVRWDVIRVRMRSPLQMTFSPTVKAKGKGRPNRTIGRKIVKACLRGVEGIEKGTTLPRYFSDESLDAARKLVKTASNDGTSLTFASNGSDKIKLTEKTVQHIEEISSRARHYVDFSTIEGRIEVVSVHEHRSFFLWEVLTNNRIECFGSDVQFEKAVSLLGKRVAVTGRVTYRNHVPQRINMEGSIRLLRESSDLPQPKDIGPIDITAGLSSEEHVRRMRNA